MTHIGQTFKFNDYQISFKGVNLFVGHPVYFETPVLGLRLGVYFTFAWDNNKKNPHLNFLKRNSS